MSDTLDRTPSFAEVLKTSVAARLAEVHTALPAKVEKYYSDKQTIDAKPLLKSSYLKEDGTLEVEDLQIINEVPLVFPGAGGFRLTFPVQVGDTVLLVFSEASMDKWIQQGGNVDPLDTRRFHIADAIAIPGLHPNNAAWTGASTSNATLGKDGGPQIHFKSGQIAIADENATESAVLGDSFKSAVSNALTAIATALTTMGAGGGTPMPGSLAVTAGTSVTTAVVSFNASAAAALSQTVKVK